MKHGDKAKAKSAKAKTSGKESSAQSDKKVAAKSSKAGESGKKSVGKASAEASGKAAGEKGSGKASPGNGKPRGRAVADEPPAFANPVVANAFKRAVKKYPNAFRKLTD